MGWRLIIKYSYYEEAVDVADVQELRHAVLRLRLDPRVTGYRYFRIREDERRQACPACGRRYWPGDLTEQTCRCGLGHTIYRCLRCRTQEIEPPYSDGCGPIPFDAEGYRYRTRRR
ncbi:MAG TPA: hypothetical protein VIL37_12845 [Natronosporangium sp.]